MVVNFLGLIFQTADFHQFYSCIFTDACVINIVTYIQYTSVLIRSVPDGYVYVDGYVLET